ncbi:hypothetical protein HK104_004000 [Borealophlyctis nickersoniae]|nr:hypothetical protein HK104_004000 [Borealophlyctis nickersoniae]
MQNFAIPSSLLGAATAVQRAKEEDREQIAKKARELLEGRPPRYSDGGDITNIPLVAVTGSAHEQARLAMLAMGSAIERERDGGKEARIQSATRRVQQTADVSTPDGGTTVLPPLTPRPNAPSQPTQQAPVSLVEDYIARLRAPRILVADRPEHVLWEKRGLHDLARKEVLAGRVKELEKEVGEVVLDIGRAVELRAVLEREVEERRRKWEMNLLSAERNTLNIS